MITTTERVLFLKGVELFAKIPGEDLVQVARIATEVLFETGETVMEQGEIGDCLFLIIEGTVRVANGDVEIARLGRNECVGEMSILDSEPRSASVYALNEVVALKISHDDFYDMMDEHAAIARGIITTLTHRLRDTIARDCKSASCARA